MHPLNGEIYKMFSMKAKSKKNYLSIGLILVAGITLTSCGSPADKAKKIEKGLSNNAGVLYKDVQSENPQIITYSIEPDSTTVVLIHDLRANKTDTLTTLIPQSHIVEVVPVEDGYLYIQKQERQDGNEHYLYQAAIERNIDNPEERTTTYLRVVPDCEEVASSAYVIDRKGKKITLSSYHVVSTYADIYHTVYDFKGNKIVEDPIHINIPTQQTYTSSPARSTEYVWECQKCGKKRTSSKKPSIFDFTCHGNGERDGFGNSHEWVKIGEI